MSKNRIAQFLPPAEAGCEYERAQKRRQKIVDVENAINELPGARDLLVIGIPANDELIAGADQVEIIVSLYEGEVPIDANLYNAVAGILRQAIATAKQLIEAIESEGAKQ